MNKLFRNTLLAVAMTAGFSMAAQAATADEVPPVSQDPVVQHLKLSNDQLRVCIRSLKPTSTISKSKVSKMAR